MSDVSWIVVADSSHARIFINQYATEKKIALVREYSDKDLHKKTSDLVIGDLNVSGAGTHVETSNPKFLHTNQFANALAKRLEHFRTDHAFQKLLFVAPPTFMGLIKEHLSKELLKISTTIEKDYTHDQQDKLYKHLEEQLKNLNNPT